MDHATSCSPAVQAQLDRLAALSPGRDILGLERITELLARLGNPQSALPPVLHVAGTNGKGSTCAFLRAAIEAAGLKAHVYTSPHLVRFNERIRLAGTLIEDEALAALLAKTLDAAEGMTISFFEATTAAAFLAFAHTPADACIVEVGLGGRLDATNVIERPLVCGIAALGHDHHAFLGDSLEQIAAEKGGIAKASAPLVTLFYPQPAIRSAIGECVERAGTTWLQEGAAWEAESWAGTLTYRDEQGRLGLPTPRLAGAHQSKNAALAVAMLRHQRRLAIPPSALKAAMEWVEWPARLQKLNTGPLRDLLPAGADLWLDGAHNPEASGAISDFLESSHFDDRPIEIICGLLANKDLKGILRPLKVLASRMQVVPVPGHEHHDPAALAAAAGRIGIAATPATNVEEALTIIAARGSRRPPVVLIMGSLYLAGEVLAANNQLPD